MSWDYYENDFDLTDSEIYARTHRADHTLRILL